MNLQYFNSQSFVVSLKSFFAELNVPIIHFDENPTTAAEILGDKFNPNNPAHKIIDDVYVVGMVDDTAFGLDSASNILTTTDAKNITTDYDGILIFGVTLNQPNPTRTQLADITRILNRVFPHTPVAVIFKYGNYIAFANTERTKYQQKWREGEKAGKVSLLRDIDIEHTHRGHIDILRALEITRSGKKPVNSFSSLYEYWQEVFNVSILNKKFYKELQTWYFWAIKEVTFPGTPNRFDYETDEKWDEAVKEHKGKNVIRLLTRILFIWFIKEKKLIPEQLFDENILVDKLIKDFVPQKPHGVFATGKQNSQYYRAILQNLFFATLNQEMGKRAFRIEGSNQNVTNLMRYKSYIKDPEYFVNLMEEVVPFMNGGLFECLDKPHPTAKGKQGGDIIIYTDGFSDHDANELQVPDYLFFDIDEDIDVSDEIGSKDKAYKNAKTRGLLEILKSYKFTITENTPIEEDVALDPELLGKVFENLLASYNPETKTTARKQTGSFYTPREIVNYMVDESLIAYMKTALNENDLPEEQLDRDLHELLSYNEINPFADNAVVQKQLIEGLDKCSILDPACGSGAFPMGILQKMVHVLHKIDPNNTEWKQRQINRADKAIESLEEIDDDKFREQSIKDLKSQKKDIEDSFQNNELDYGRKLYLIENCIYGVDIQSIATQISKLRFFISLIVDQKIDKTKANFGIRPLPNLETKFVAANTLIGIDKPNAQLNLFDNEDVNKLERELKKVRHRLYSAKTPATKKKLREEDKALRNQIADVLILNGCENHTARQLAGWDPYDQNESSSFFDAEWMFDMKEGFDIVIGNPPYGAKLTTKEKTTYKLTYPETQFKIDTYSLFLLHSSQVLKEFGICTFIIPNTLLDNYFEENVRKKILLKNRLREICDLNDKVFESAVVHAMVISYVNEFVTTDYNVKINTSTNLYGNYNFIPKSFFEIQDKCIYQIRAHKSNDLFEKLKLNSERLEDVLDIRQAIKSGNDKVYIVDTKITADYKPILCGKDVFRYSFKNQNKYINYGNHLACPRPREIFEQPKILIREAGAVITATYDDSNFYIMSSLYNAISKHKEFELKYILSLINSQLFQFLMNQFTFEKTKGAFTKAKIYHYYNLPVKINQIQGPFIEIVDQILALKKDNPQSDTSVLERKIDEMVYKLYELSYEEVIVIDPLFWLCKEEYSAIEIEN